MVDDQAKVGESATGGINIELKFADYDDLLETAMAAAWQTATKTGAGSSNDIDFAAAGGGVQVITGQAADWSSFVVGAWVRVKSASNSENNGVFKVTATDSTTLTVANTAGVSETSSTATVNQNMLRNGTTKKSLFIEKQFQDLTDVNLSFTGMRVDTWSLSIDAEAIISGGFTFLGEGAAAGASLAGSVTNASANQLMNASNNVGTLTEGGAALTTPLRTVTVQINNNLRGLPAVANSQNIGVNYGRAEVTGTITAYFQDLTLYNKFINQTGTSLVVPVTDPGGNTIVVSILNMKMSEGNPAAGGINQDIVLPLTFNGLRDSTTSAVLQIDSLAV
jgi:hypothetical protein